VADELEAEGLVPPPALVGLREEDLGGGRGGEGIADEEGGVLLEPRLTAIILRLLVGSQFDDDDGEDIGGSECGFLMRIRSRYKNSS